MAFLRPGVSKEIMEVGTDDEALFIATPPQAGAASLILFERRVLRSLSAA